MKTWEMIKEIIENPKKKYRPIDRTDRYVEFKNNQLVWNGHFQFGQAMIVTETDENEWVEVEQPITFKEVLERVKEDTSHRFKVEHEELEITGFPCNKYFYLDSLIKMLESYLLNRELARVLLEGKFYIKED